MHRIPKVDKILAWPRISNALATNPRPHVLAAIRNVLQSLRATINDDPESVVSNDDLSSMIISELDRSSALSLRPVVNGTGVVIHTNLGRSILPTAAIKNIQVIAQRYSNLEMELSTGERGERSSHVERALCELTGAEAAFVVNNNAAAVLLTMSALAAGREVIVSRGELVEIGGAFRVPDVMRQSGAILREVGTTNRTHLADYQRAISTDTALLLKVHSSNFAVVGFTCEVSAADLAGLAAKNGIPVVADIGSGCLLDLSPYGIKGEPTISEYVKSGVGLITCSGDKLLGGPQAGIILGLKELIGELRRHPLARAVRIDKLTLAALEATLKLYRDDRQALAEIPSLRMLVLQPAELRIKGRSYIRRLRKLAPPSVHLCLEDGFSQVGGGALPLQELPTVLVSVASQGLSAGDIDATFRNCRIPVVGRINKDRYLLDIRTLLDDDLPALVEAISSLDSLLQPVKPSA